MTEKVEKTEEGRDPKTGRWKEGFSGNPAGSKPKPDSFTGCLRKLLEDTDDNGVPYHQRLAELVLEMALMKRTKWAIDMIVNRVDGLCVQKIQQVRNIDLVKSEVWGNMFTDDEVPNED